MFDQLVGKRAELNQLCVLVEDDYFALSTHKRPNFLKDLTEPRKVIER